MAERALKIIEDEIAELEAVIPHDVMVAPLDALNGAELMARGALEGFRQLNRIISQPMDIEGTIAEQSAFGLKQQRLVGDMSGMLIKQAREQHGQERNHDLIGRLLAAMAAEREEDCSED